MEYIRLYNKMVVIYCYFGKENDKVLKLYMNNSSYVEISLALHLRKNTVS